MFGYVISTLISCGCLLCLNSVQIVMTTDEKFASKLVVALTSMFENSNHDTFYEVTILTHGNLKNGNAHEIVIALKGKYEGCEINFIDMGHKYEDIAIYENWPLNILYRLDVASVLSYEKKCIFLDGDIYVRHDLSELFNLDISNYYVGGVLDYVFSVPHEFLSKSAMQFYLGYLKNLGLPDADQYICDGIIVMNLESIRVDGIEDKFHQLLEKIKSKTMMPDQDIINTVCYGKILLIPVKFDVFPNYVDYNISYESSMYAQVASSRTGWEEAKDPTIVHLNGPKKPWFYPNISVYHAEWWIYARMTTVFRELLREFEIFKKRSERIKRRKKKGKVNKSGQESKHGKKI